MVDLGGVWLLGRDACIEVLRDGASKITLLPGVWRSKADPATRGKPQVEWPPPKTDERHPFLRLTLPPNSRYTLLVELPLTSSPAYPPTPNILTSFVPGRATLQNIVSCVSTSPPALRCPLCIPAAISFLTYRQGADGHHFHDSTRISRLAVIRLSLAIRSLDCGLILII